VDRGKGSGRGDRAGEEDEGSKNTHWVTPIEGMPTLCALSAVLAMQTVHSLCTQSDPPVREGRGSCVFENDSGGLTASKSRTVLAFVSA
jgi:hypothetical protein